jgi:uncharacterized YigZ family protein
MIDTYKTLSKESMAEYKDRGSKFIAYAYPLSIEADFTAFLEKLKKEHPKARHHCFAWRLGMDSNRYRANDDGEPSGTAGRPILGQIDSFGLTNVGVIVVRYFGGTLLGTSGLIEAYRESTAEALRNTEIIEKIIEDTFEIIFEYDKMPNVMNALKKLNINVLSQNYNENGVIKISIRQSEAEEKIIQMRAQVMKISVDETRTREDTEGVLINKME